MGYDLGAADLLENEGVHVHRWVVRRWSAFNIATTSMTGLILSLVIGIATKIQWPIEWWLPVVIFVGLLCSSAVLAWRETMGMPSFMASLPSIESESS